MGKGITKSMYVRTLTKEEYEAVQKKNAKEIKRITGISHDFTVADFMVPFIDKPIEHGLYKFEWNGEKEIWYIVQGALSKERVFCYEIS